MRRVYGSARQLWAELRERDVQAHREHLLQRAEIPSIALAGHRVYTFLVFAFGVVIGLGVGFAW